MPLWTELADAVALTDSDEFILRQDPDYLRTTLADLAAAIAALVAVVPPGTVIAHAGSSAPDGYLDCDGSDVSRTTYAGLFAALGETWGPGDGSTTFTLPDLRGRAPIGAGTGSGLSPRTLADVGGEEDHALVESELPNHLHTVDYIGNRFTVQGGAANNAEMVNSGGGTAAVDSSVVGSDTAHNTMQPFAVVQYLVKT